MEDFNLLAPLLLAIVGLLVGAILKSILKRTGFPYTVGLFVFGLLIGLFNRFHYFDFMPRVENAVATVADTNPACLLQSTPRGHGRWLSCSAPSSVQPTR